MSAYRGDRVQIDLMIRGFAQAQERYARAAEATGPEPAYFALFEALNWAVAVDDVVAEIWRPGGAREGYSWRSRIESSDILVAARTARNLVHHHWARAPQFVVRNGRHGWVWPDAASLPPATRSFDSNVGIQEYARLMAGVSVADTLHQIGGVFVVVGDTAGPAAPLVGSRDSSAALRCELSEQGASRPPRAGGGLSEL
jgi:hypothetical protein